MTSNGQSLSEQKIARIMAGNAEQAILTATEEDGTAQERSFAFWRAGRLLREISKLELKLPSVGQEQAAS